MGEPVHTPPLPIHSEREEPLSTPPPPPPEPTDYSPPGIEQASTLVFDTSYRTKIENDPELADRIIERLNLLLESNDDVRRDIASVLLMRQQVFAGTANHPTIQVGSIGHEGMPMVMGFLGILNGICGVIDGPFTSEEKEARSSHGFDPEREEFHDGRGVIRSREFEGWGYIGAVWEEGQLVRFERTGAERLGTPVMTDVPDVTANATGVSSVESVTEHIMIVINGKRAAIVAPGGKRRATYDDLVRWRYELAGEVPNPQRVWTITYKIPGDVTGHPHEMRHKLTLSSDPVELVDGMLFNVTDTDGFA